MGKIRAIIYMSVPCLSFAKINNPELPVILTVTLDRILFGGCTVINLTCFIFCGKK